MAPHVEHMVEEKAELSDRIEKLGEFMDSSPVYQGLPALDRALMRRQHEAMLKYLGALAARLARAE